MKKFSIAMLLLLTSCQAFEKNEASLKQTAHDVVDEVIDDTVEKADKK